MKTIKQLLITIAVLLCSATTYAYDFEVDGIYYNIISTTDLTVKVTNGDNEYSGEVVIPSTVNYNGEVYSVTSIGGGAFCDCSSLTSIEIPNSVTSIGDRAFGYCTSLKDLHIDDGNTTLELGYNDVEFKVGLFRDCSLETLYIGRNLSYGTTYYDDSSPFSYQDQLETIIISNKVTSIGEHVFYNCSGLTSIEIPNSVTSIGGYAFYGCSSMTSIEIPNSVTSIGEDAFYECSSMTSVTFGENSQLTSIGSGAFYNCDGLASIEIPDSVISIESPDFSSSPPYCGAFGSCSNLKTVTFGENSQLTSIGGFAFESCSSLTSVEIPNSVTTIRGGAFYNCDSLTSIEIPDSVISIEGVYASSGYNYGAFDYCSNLKTVTFGENSQLTSIGDAAFRGCTSLTSIEIPNSVTTIRGGAFYNCDSLTSIEIPDSVISIEECLYSPFSEDYGAFGNCSNLKTVTFGKNSQLTSIGGGAFYDCDSLTSIEIPSSVISIKSHHIGVFGECSNLKIVTFNENSQLTSIGRYAFDDCSSLTSIEIPSSVTSIGEYAFDDCSSLTSIEIPSSVTSIGEYAFQGCTLLKDLRMEDGYTTLELGYRLFLNCTLETIYLGRNISYDNSENPEDLLFDDMITLKTLTVGSDVAEIPGKTFYDCTNLESVYMRGVPPIISDDTFSNTSYYVATLYVPEGTLAFYQTANVWKNFWNIQEYEPTSIENIEANEVNFTITSNGISFSNADNSTICIYTINGILVKKIDKYTGEEITLENGVYIVCVGDKAMKIIL